MSGNVSNSSNQKAAGDESTVSAATEASPRPSRSTAQPDTDCAGGADGADLSHYFHFGSNKAGMNDDAMDQKRRQEIILEMSKDSSYFKRASKVSERNQQRAQEMMQRMNALTPQQRMTYQARCDEDCMRLEARREVSRVCCVVDMDMFFAAVEIRDNPRLKDLPVAVGGMSMISTSNYVARKFGVRSAMPGFIAKRLCPDLVFVPCDFTKYEAASEVAQSVVRRYEPGYKHDSGLDEFYVDITHCVSERHAQLHGSNTSPSVIELRKTAELVVAEMRAAITESTGGLTCSAGIANNFFLAKICADRNKPDGQFSLPPTREDIIDFVRQLPCRKVGGIGKVFEKLLNDLGMTTIGDVAQNLARLYHVLTPSMLQFLTRTSMGIGREEELGQTSGRRGWGAFGDDSGEGGSAAPQKSVGTERTFRATEDRKELYMKLYDVSLSVVARIKEKGLHPHQLTLKVKGADFDLFTRSTSRASSGSSSSKCFFTEVDDVFAAAKELLDAFPPTMKIRLLGVSLSHFKEEVNANKSKVNGQQDIASFFSKSTSTSETMENFAEFIDPELGLESHEIEEEAEHDSHEIDGNNSKFYCPVCDRELPLSSLAALNGHIDECLSVAALREEGVGVAVIKEGELGSSGAKSEPRSCDSDVFGSSNQEDRKKRKLEYYMKK